LQGRSRRFQALREQAAEFLSFGDFADAEGEGGIVHPPYVDNRPLLVAGKPEVRRYRCRYILSDVEIGVPSDEVVVTAQPY
jgi:hypothetical protein